MNSMVVRPLQAKNQFQTLKPSRTRQRAQSRIRRKLIRAWFSLCVKINMSQLTYVSVVIPNANDRDYEIDYSNEKVKDEK